jgi:hypothetical protein
VVITNTSIFYQDAGDAGDGNLKMEEKSCIINVLQESNLVIRGEK